MLLKVTPRVRPFPLWGPSLALSSPWTSHRAVCSLWGHTHLPVVSFWAGFPLLQPAGSHPPGFLTPPACVLSPRTSGHIYGSVPSSQQFMINPGAGDAEQEPCPAGVMPQDIPATLGCFGVGWHPLVPAGLQGADPCVLLGSISCCPPCHLPLSPIPALLSPCSWAHSGLILGSFWAHSGLILGSLLHLHTPGSVQGAGQGWHSDPAGCSGWVLWVWDWPQGAAATLSPLCPQHSPANLGLLCHSHPWSSLLWGFTWVHTGFLGVCSPVPQRAGRWGRVQHHRAPFPSCPIPGLSAPRRLSGPSQRADLFSAMLRISSPFFLFPLPPLERERMQGRRKDFHRGGDWHSPE
ncbi:uncharacterized protein LOC117001813 [Catharus ustulatus]|uniref:uncharacterized protein LOC117001813 n=1 Tax=Catharus ustulatus TaxID=91951 RepID=UPI00140BB338|nr:uncharacterized protein LOC117001813 [Catharus ustulatus]